MGTWTNFPMPAGEYCTRDKKYIEELYTRFGQIRNLQNLDTISWVSNRYATGWKLYVLDRGSYTENAIKYLRNRIEAGLLTWWFWNDGTRPFFVHAVKADVLNTVIGQADWTNEDFIQMGTHSPHPILDELHKVIDWIAKNIYVRRRTYGITTNGMTEAYYNGNYNSVGPIYNWLDSRIGFTGQVGDICDDIPNRYTTYSSYWDRPYAFTVLSRSSSSWNTDYTFTGYFTIAIMFDVSLNIREDLWPTALKDTSIIKMWWGEQISWTHFLGSFAPIPPPSPFGASNLGYITAPIKIGGILQGEVNSDENAIWREQILDVTPGDFNFTSGTVLQYDMDEIALKGQLFVPPNRTEDIDEWDFPIAYLLSESIENDAVIYRCILAHTSSADDEPGVGVNWETYWILAPEPGWYQGDTPSPSPTKSEYGWSIGQLQGFMIRPSFSWI